MRAPRLTPGVVTFARKALESTVGWRELSAGVAFDDADPHRQGDRRPQRDAVFELLQAEQRVEVELEVADPPK